jgi:Zn-dependent peptidase ImmA (M78 family)
MIKIAGIDYQILYKSNQEMGGLIGTANFNAQEICINADHTAQTQRIALYHEIIHILSDAYGLELTEQQVKIGTHAVLAFLHDNPQLPATAWPN